MTEPAPEPTTDWTQPLRHGVSVQHVRELATHIERLAPGGTDPDFGAKRARITDEQVARWINMVADSVDARMVALAQYSAHTELWAGIVGSARTAITNGAAAYLVSAAFPARAGTNDQGNYSAELDARYEREMEFLVELPAVLKDDETINPVPVVDPTTVNVGIRGTANPAYITDDSPLFHHTRGLPARYDPNVYRRPTAPGAEDSKPYRADPYWPS